MDLDGNAVVSQLEVESYFNRNKYLLCRPYVNETVKKYESEKRQMDFEFKNMFDIFDSN